MENMQNRSMNEELFEDTKLGVITVASRTG